MIKLEWEDNGGVRSVHDISRMNKKSMSRGPD